jgi:hypothetical protein
MANAPLSGRDGMSYKGDFESSEKPNIFAEGLDRDLRSELVGQIRSKEKKDCRGFEQAPDGKPAW